MAVVAIPVSERLLAGVMQLYRATSLRHFYAYLKRLLHERMRGIPFSVLNPSEEEDAFTIEYCSAFELFSFSGATVESRGLGDVFRRGADCNVEDRSLVIPIPGGGELPISYIKILEANGAFLGVLAFHGGVSDVMAESLAGSEAFVCKHICSALQLVREREKLQTALERSNARLSAVSDMGSVFGHLELDVLLARIMAVFTRLASAQVGSITLVCEQKDVEWGLPRALLDRLRERDGPSVREVALECKTAILISQYAGDDRYESICDYSVASVLCVPLISQGNVLGTVNLVNSDGPSGRFTEADREIAVAISSLAATALENCFLHKEIITQERLKAGLQIASRIQRGMYPQESPALPGYDIAWMTSSCDETGGDYLDFCTTRDNMVVLAIGDVSGHGIAAALIMASSRAHLRALLSVEMQLEDALTRLNDLLVADMDPDRFMTMCLLELQGDAIRYVNAGHDRPILLSSAKGTTVELDSSGIPLGMMGGTTYDAAGQCELQKGDIVLLTTDGIWEANNGAGELFGRPRLHRLIVENANSCARDIVLKIVDEVEAFSRNGVYKDDRTLAVLRRVE